MRIERHPIIEGYGKGRAVRFWHDGQEAMGFEGEPVAAALKALGVAAHRVTGKRHEPRGVFCAIGRCTDCVMVVDGVPNTRTCVTPLAEGMRVDTQHGTGSAGAGGHDDPPPACVSVATQRGAENIGAGAAKGGSDETL